MVENNSYIYYIFLMVAVIVAFLIVKRVASCLVRSLVLIMLVAVLAYVYFTFLR